MNEVHILDDEQRIAAFRLSVICRALALEIRTGMKLARNQPTVAQLRDQYGITARTKRDALEQLTELSKAQDREVGLYQ